MNPATALDAVRDHPRHLVLFALTTGLLLGPLSPGATTTATIALAALTTTAALTAPRPREPAHDHARAGRDSHENGRRRPDPETEEPEPVGPKRLPRPAGPLAAGLPAQTGGGSAGPLGVGPLVTTAVGEPEAEVDSPRRSRWAVRRHAVGAFLLGAVVASAVLGGAMVADLRLAALGGGVLPRLEAREIKARAVVLEPFRERARGPAVARGRFVDGAARGDVAVLRVPPETHPGDWPGVGEIVVVAGRVAELGVFDAYQRRRGALAAVDVARMGSTGERRGGVAGVVDGARRRAEDGLARGLPPPRVALLRGMVLGQDEQLSETTRTAFERSGLAHVLAVSGQNVMLLATLVLAVGAVTGLPLRARLVVALALVAFYVPLTGAGPSIQRAGVMGAAGLVAALAGSPGHRWYALGLAAAVTLALNPLAAGEPGWQLSFAAVVALLAVAPGLREALARAVPGPVADVAAITIAATVGTAPLMALHFDQVSLAALPANLVAAAAIAPIMWLGMLAATAAQVAPALALPFNALNEPLLGFVEWVATTTAAAPLAVVPVDVGSPAAAALAYAALAAAALVARVGWRRLMSRRDGPWGGGGRRDGPWGGGGRRRLALGAAALVAVAVLVAASNTGGPARVVRGEIVVSFLDVGQGDATLLQTDRAAVLVDTGPPDGPILERLEQAGVARLDALVLTHAQTDHEGAALEVLRKIPTRMVVNGGAGWPSAVQRALPKAIAEAHARQLDAHAGQRLTIGGLRIEVLWPPPAPQPFQPTGDPNHRAIVAHVTAGDFDLLLPADAESDVTAGLDLPPVEALKVAHHGSADAGLPGLLEQTHPAFAAIEVGRGNSYGHPAPSTLAALKAVPEVVRTDRDGTVVLRVSAGEMRVERSGRW